ncbi:MAG: PQQ-like beta-propeller repeat protein [Gemmataceae bacterium]|nr:PQQ-like beta-propeller repeat protein [Gemmataceae bacterium]MDW8242128.1 PQQ-binding-like beta-propeller repeat protein [Thermogemmata sp.]
MHQGVAGVGCEVQGRSNRNQFRLFGAAELWIAALMLVLGLGGTAHAVITRLTPLAEVLETERYIFVARVVRVDADKPAVVFQVVRHLKGEAPFQHLPVNMSGDEEAKKANDTQTILDRLHPRRQVIFFVNKRGKRYNAVAFVEGSWFSLQGLEDENGQAVRWAFLHGEPYLRRTFAGSSAELIRIIEDGLAKRATPPPPDEKAKPGYGPPASADPPMDEPAKNKEKSEGSPKKMSVRGGRLGQLWAVIPSFVLVGPLAVVAAIFPGVFARLAIAWKRWRAFLTIASLNSTLALVHYFVQDYLPGGWWWGTQALTVYLLVISLVGLIWAGARYRRLAACEPQTTQPPARTELLSLGGITLLAALCIAATIWWTNLHTAITPPMREFTCIGIALAMASLYAFYRKVTAHWDSGCVTTGSHRLSLSGESVALATLAVCTAAAWCLQISAGRSPISVNVLSGEATQAIGPRLVSSEAIEAWEDDGVQRTPLRGQVLSRVIVYQERLYFGIVEAGLSAGGRIVCLDSRSGKVLWSHDGGEKPLLPVYCTPLVADEVVYCGEGLHEHSGCRLLALDAHTGQPRWAEPFRTASHTEGTPVKSGDLLIFPAGDDGVYAVAATTGQRRWHLPGGWDRQLHVDGTPALHQGRLFVGSGLYAPAAICLDAATGQELWRTPLPFRSFGAPLLLGQHVYYGVGTGNLGADTHDYPEEKGHHREDKPAGAVVCLDATTGTQLWQLDLPRGVHTGLAGDAFNVYAACRDGSVYAVDRRTGRLRWQASIGTAITSQPAVATLGGLPVAVYAVSREGLAVCLHPQTGQPIWQHALPGFQWDGQETSGVLGGPTVVQQLLPQGSRRIIYIGAMTVDPNNPNRRTVAVFRFIDELTDD